MAVNFAASSEAAEAVVASIQSSGGSAISIGANVTDKEQLDAMVKRVIDEWGTIDILVNNAGLAFHSFPELHALCLGITRDTLMMKMKPEQWQEVIDTNLTSVFYLTQVWTLYLLCSDEVYRR